MKNSCCVIAEAAIAYVLAAAALAGTDSAGFVDHVVERDRCWFELVEAVDPDLLATFGVEAAETLGSNDG